MKSAANELCPKCRLPVLSDDVDARDPSWVCHCPRGASAARVRPGHRGLRIAAAALVAWLPTGFAVAAAAADWNAYIVLTLALGGLTTTATLAAFAWEVSYGC